jgi:hypothetical protein
LHNIDFIIDTIVDNISLPENTHIHSKNKSQYKPAKHAQDSDGEDEEA